MEEEQNGVAELGMIAGGKGGGGILPNVDALGGAVGVIPSSFFFLETTRFFLILRPSLESSDEDSRRDGFLRFLFPLSFSVS